MPRRVGDGPLGMRVHIPGERLEQVSHPESWAPGHAKSLTEPLLGARNRPGNRRHIVLDRAF